MYEPRKGLYRLWDISSRTFSTMVVYMVRHEQREKKERRADRGKKGCRRGLLHREIWEEFPIR